MRLGFLVCCNQVGKTTVSKYLVYLIVSGKKKKVKVIFFVYFQIFGFLMIAKGCRRQQITDSTVEAIEFSMGWLPADSSFWIG